MNVAKLAGMGAAAISIGIVVVFAGFIWLTTHNAMSGIDPIESHVAWISVGTLCAALVAVHLVYARILLRGAKPDRP